MARPRKTLDERKKVKNERNRRWRVKKQLQWDALPLPGEEQQVPPTGNRCHRLDIDWPSRLAEFDQVEEPAGVHDEEAAGEGEGEAADEGEEQAAADWDGDWDDGDEEEEEEEEGEQQEAAEEDCWDDEEEEEEEEEEETEESRRRSKLLDDISFHCNKLRFQGLSHDGCQVAFKFMLEHSADIVQVQQDASTCRGVGLPSHMTSLRRRMQKRMPSVYNIPYTFVSEKLVGVGPRGGGGTLFLKEKKRHTAKFLEKYKEKITRSHHYVPLKELLDFVLRLHDEEGNKEAWKTVDIGVDGVSISPASHTKLIVVSLVWPSCGRPFIYAIHTFTKGRGPNANDILKPILEEMKELSMFLRRLRADGQERKMLKCMVATGGL
jgi:hypothetical protein